MSTGVGSALLSGALVSVGDVGVGVVTDAATFSTTSCGASTSTAAGASVGAATTFSVGFTTVGAAGAPGFGAVKSAYTSEMNAEAFVAPSVCAAFCHQPMACVQRQLERHAITTDYVT
jgi:hypothetical protein